MFLNTTLIHRLGRTDGDRLAIDIDDFFQLDRIYAMQGIMQRSFRAEQAHLLGLMKQLVAKIRMGNADHGHGPLLQALFMMPTVSAISLARKMSCVDIRMALPSSEAAAPRIKSSMPVTPEKWL